MIQFSLVTYMLTLYTALELVDVGCFCQSPAKQLNYSYVIHLISVHCLYSVKIATLLHSTLQPKGVAILTEDKEWTLI
jgi:hypothetical protein